jgi:glutamate dehydrogenase
VTALPRIPAISWEDRFQVLLERAVGKPLAESLATRYLQGIPGEYRARVPFSLAVRDCLRLEQVQRTGKETVDLWSEGSRGGAAYRLQLYRTEERYLDEILPVLQNLGLRIIDQIQFVIEFGEGCLFIRSFAVETSAKGASPLRRLKKPLLEALDALMSSRAEDDALNGLLVMTGLSWKAIDIFRGYRNYFFQLGSRFTQARFHQALLANPVIARLLFRYFEARFEPDQRWTRLDRREEEALSPVRQHLLSALDGVSDINEDRILRDLFNLIDATLRTNFYLRKDRDDYFFAFKIDSLGVIGMPSPKPLFEVYVHGFGMEAIHLRGAKVARGGLRWSDRPDDFRSEILDLMQTQMSKNALIVPQGAKGGFVLKTDCRDAEECRPLLAKQAYVQFIRGLLDLTDNLGPDRVVRPPQIICYDDADPYLVVAADKGTARLSDTANAVAQEYDFWLGDAFASGGSHGYNHKKLGITARGAWQCVEWHFRELGRDIGGEAFTVVGIGSLDGDVFGNGMLLSRNLRLLAAFGAQHIFLDPNPDAELSYAERRRMFELPHSTWDDYDRRVISPGGGVFRRDAKDIPLAPEVRQWLGVRHASIDGEALIRLLLTAPVDLLWLGGIGTYIKASSEVNEDVGDRLNDSVRVDACQLRARVAGEGANLGFTQKGRVEYALHGGRINTDAVDNSGGVDLSDHEVNLKILMARLRQQGLIADESERNRWLGEVTEEVCRLVLAHNRNQSLCLSLDFERCQRNPGAFLDLVEYLENAALLDRQAESFPSRKEIQARLGQGLTRPELAVLVSHAKLALKKPLLANSDFLASEGLQGLYVEYFPAPIREHFGAHLGEHPLVREITATQVCNAVIDQAGSSFLTWVEEPSADLATEAVSAYLGFDQVLDGATLRARIVDRRSSLAANRQLALLLSLEDALAQFCRWALNRGERVRLTASTLALWRGYLDQLTEYRLQNLPAPERLALDQRLAVLVQEGLVDRDARLLAMLDHLIDFPALVELAGQSGEPFVSAVTLQDAVAAYLGLDRVFALLRSIAAREDVERRAMAVMQDRLNGSLGRLSLAMLGERQVDPVKFFARHGQHQRLARIRRLQEGLGVSQPASPLSCAALIAEIDGLADACSTGSEHL